jgi:hypothetical protein
MKKIFMFFILIFLISIIILYFYNSKSISTGKSLNDEGVIMLYSISTPSYFGNVTITRLNYTYYYLYQLSIITPYGFKSIKLNYSSTELYLLIPKINFTEDFEPKIHFPNKFNLVINNVSSGTTFQVYYYSGQIKSYGFNIVGICGIINGSNWLLPLNNSYLLYSHDDNELHLKLLYTNLAFNPNAVAWYSIIIISLVLSIFISLILYFIGGVK